MSSHADTIRRYIKAEYPPQPASQAANNAEDAVDAMEAENQQLRDALEQIERMSRPCGAYGRVDYGSLPAASKIARAALAAVRVEERP
jgi:hypothetical protein